MVASKAPASRSFIDRHEASLCWLGAVLLAIFFLATSFSIAHRRLLWFDEVNTVNVAKLPDLQTMWAVQNSFFADSAPILYHLIVRLVYGLSGHAEWSVRFLSAMAMIVAMLVVFDCARRLSDGVHGLIAFSALGCSFLTYYGYEGRPYALVTMFTAIALWLWLNTKPDSKLAASAFGLTIFCAVMMHFQAVLALVPFGAWELYRWRPWKMPSPKLVAGVIGMFCAFGVSAQQMRHSAGWSANSWCPPSVPALVRVLAEMFPTALFVIAMFILLVSLAGTEVRPMSDGERLSWFFLAVPLAGFILAEVVTKNFYNRYLISTLPGVAVGFGCLVSRHLTRRGSIAFLLFLVATIAGRQLGQMRNAEGIEPPSALGQQEHTRAMLAIEDGLVADGRKVIITDFLLLDQAQYYSKRPELYVIYDADEVNPGFCRFARSACWTLDALKSHASEAVAMYPSDKLLAAMMKAGYQAIVKTPSPMVVYFAPAK